ncbi:MAG: HAMP domain-containing sensor histidine kinase [Bacteroidetes bacterium]|nr:HAMP domain-containing sensor histidine kinase [Bacteroidota bacterium]
MNIYYRKQIWKITLLTVALGIAVLSLWYTEKLVDKLSKEEEKKVKLWAEGTKRLTSMETTMSEISFLFNTVVQNNTTVPVILTNQKGEIVSWRNVDSLKALNSPDYLKEELLEMKADHEPIVIPLTDHHFNYIYYKDSLLLTQLRYYPYAQLTVIAIFILVSYLAFSSSRNAEQNQVWVGMAKETAHQLGTPLSSLMGWLEYLKSTGLDEATSLEIEKDINRLETVTQRFSKIGATPVLLPLQIKSVVEQSLHYLKSRVSKKVELELLVQCDEQQMVPLNQPLFEWVIENLFKNAVDAMEGEGSLKVIISAKDKHVFIDFVDTGKGVNSSDFKRIFRPGFTTKTRGWGLGLSLAKRIVEYYHKGKIFVKESEVGKGSTFRVMLKK